MPPNDENLLGSAGADGAGYGDPLEAGGDLLDRVRAVSRRIVERVRRVTGDTQIDYPSLPTDPTDEQPPI